MSVGGTFEVCWNCGTSRDGTEDHGFRRQLFHELTGPSQRLLKGIRWLLLRNPDNLDNTKNERQRLERALKINKPLAIAYYLKEDLWQIWQQPDKRLARLALDEWLAQARASGIRDTEFFKLKILGHHEAHYALVG